MTSRKLQPDEVYAVGHAAVRNALELMTDAEVLLRADRPRAAYALGVSAAEEAAKFNSCRDLLHAWSGELTVADLRTILRPPQGQAHQQRYASFLGYLLGLAMLSGGPIPPALLDLEATAKEDLAAHSRILYVELTPERVLMTPEGVSEDEARQWVTPMVDLFVMNGRPWIESLNDGLEEARGTSDA